MNIDEDSSLYLTGGTGFVGTHLRDLLAHRGVDVTLLVREGHPVETRATERVERGDVTDQASVHVEGHDVIVHLAAQTSIATAINIPGETWDVNATGTYNVLDAARRGNVDKVLYASTASVYGRPNYLPIDEDHPTDPTEPYGASKLAGDGLVRAYGRTYDISTTILRLFNVFGPGQPAHNVVPTIIAQALEDGETIRLGNLSPVRDFVYVSDVVQAFITVLERGRGGTVYNVGRGQGASVETVANTVVDLLDEELRVTSTADRQRAEDVEIPRHVADVDRLRSLGWEPSYNLVEGLRETLKAAGADT